MSKRAEAGDALGDRMKAYERRETERRFMPGLPLYARIDGRGFSGFTKGMQRPYDPEMVALMTGTLGALLEETHAIIGYTQSDKISLVWHLPDTTSQLPFGGKPQKMCSLLAAMSTAHFTRLLLKSPLAGYADRVPHFDCRVFQLPTEEEAVNALLWREIDATKNAISMAAHHYLGHKATLGLNSAQKQEALWQEHEVNFNDYPSYFKRGVWMRRVTEERTLSSAELERIPEAKRPAADHKFLRSSVRAIQVPSFRKVVNRREFVFAGAQPEVAGE